MIGIIRRYLLLFIVLFSVANGSRDWARPRVETCKSANVQQSAASSIGPGEAPTRPRCRCSRIAGEACSSKAVSGVNGFYT